jgi:hypothetical protein
MEKSKYPKEEFSMRKRRFERRRFCKEEKGKYCIENGGGAP